MNVLCVHRLFRKALGFSLPEVLLTVALLGILTSVVVSALSNASRDAGRMVGRQQQGAINSAIQQWITAQTRHPTTGRVQSTNTIRGIYNAYGTSLAKLQAVGDYLSDQTLQHFLDYTTNSGTISSEALRNAKQVIELPAWGNGEDAPRVDLRNE
jgi:prepilin-type N-terminal cleavage/methylation domain-containing protein